MNRLIVGLLSAALAFCARPVKTQAQTPIVLCVGVTVTALGAVVAINACRPSYRCISDPEVYPRTNWCSTMTRSAAAASELECGPINYKSFKRCMSHCADTNTVRTARSEPEPSWIVEKATTVAGPWKACGRLEMSYEGDTISWEELVPAGAAVCYYRVKEVYED